MPKNGIEKRHDALVAQIVREPEKFFCKDIIAGEKIYARSEPWSFGHARKRVDGFVVLQTSTKVEIIVFELKIGRRQIDNGYAQLKTVVEFFADSDLWLGWANDILKAVSGQREIWLTIELLTTEGTENGNEKIESYNLFPDYLLPKRRFVGLYPAEPAKKIELISYVHYGITIGDVLEGKR